MLREGRIRFAVGSGDRGAIAKRPYFGVLSVLHRRLNYDSAAFVLRDWEARYHRARDNAGRQNDRVGGNGFIRHVYHV